MDSTYGVLTNYLRLLAYDVDVTRLPAMQQRSAISNFAETSLSLHSYKLVAERRHVPLILQATGTVMLPSNRNTAFTGSRSLFFWQR